MIRVLIAEDQQMLRGALASLIKLEDDIEVVAEASSGKEAWELICRCKPDVSLLDIEMPPPSGLELAEMIRREGYDTKVIIVTTFARPGYLQKAMDAKVDGYLLKDEPIDSLIDSIRKVYQGKQVLSTDLALSLFRKEENPLTEREIEVLQLVQDGLTTKEIAQKLFLTNGTIRNYLSSAIQKLEVDTRQQAIEKAREYGWI